MISKSGDRTGALRGKGLSRTASKMVLLKVSQRTSNTIVAHQLGARYTEIPRTEHSHRLARGASIALDDLKIHVHVQTDMGALYSCAELV